MTTEKFQRIEVSKELEQVILSNKPEFVFVRGRRRIGKSWLLKSLTKKFEHHCFYFTVGPDHSNEEILTQFATELSEFSGESSLTEKKSKFLTWKTIFTHLYKYSLQSKTPLTIILDEIQWIAKEGSGFLGKLKEAWIQLEQDSQIKIIICGSSNKFFVTKSGGAETVLRGLRTRSDIFVPPITLSECYYKRFKKWSPEEVVILYFLTGGIPYYLNQVDCKKPFISAINDAFFTSQSIYIAEVDEIISLDFNKQGSKTVKIILEAIGTNGCSESHIVKKTRLPKSTVHLVLGKLVAYKLIEPVQSLSEKMKVNDSGVKYLIADFYLATYFRLIKPLIGRIEHNKNSILFKFSASNLYIENYTGPLFERLVRQILLERNLRLKLFEKLKIRSTNFELNYYWDKSQQIDLIINSSEDRVSRAIEIKWRSFTKADYTVTMNDHFEKQYPVSPYFTRTNHLVCTNVEGSFKERDAIITVKDLMI